MSVIEQPPVDISQPPGVTLRKARERAGLTLDAVSQSTMIPLSRLRALENDDYDRVGVATFVIGYTRSYARFIGVDPSPLVQMLEASLPQVEPVPVQSSPVALSLHAQRRPRSFFWPTVLAVVVILGVVAVIGVNTASLVAPDPAAQTSVQNDVSDSSTLNLPLEVNVTAEPSTPAELLPLETPGPADSALEQALADTDFAVTPSSARPQEIPQVAAAPTSTAAPGTAPPNSATTSADTLTLTFAGDCWVSVTDATGKALIARLATSRDNLRLFGQAPFEVVLGDATAVAGVTFNGRVIDSAPQPGRKARRLTVGP